MKTTPQNARMHNRFQRNQKDSKGIQNLFIDVFGSSGDMQHRKKTFTSVLDYVTRKILC
jgi:hypothetical protein